MLARCWNCTNYQSCTDYRTFAYGCLCCVEDYQPKWSLRQVVKNLADFAKLKKQGPPKVDEPGDEPKLPDWIFQPLCPEFDI